MRNQLNSPQTDAPRDPVDRQAEIEAEQRRRRAKAHADQARRALNQARKNRPTQETPA